MKFRNPIKLLAFTILFCYCHSAKSQSKEELVLSYELHDPVSDTKKRELIDFFRSRDNADYYVIPEIPRRKLKKSSKRCYVPRTEVLVLVDAQLFGPAKDCLIIGSSGVYFKNGWLAEQPGRHFIPFDKFKNCEISIKRDEIAIGDLQFDPSGSMADLEFLINLLKDLQKKV